MAAACVIVRYGRLHPPGKIIGKARERTLKRLAGWPIGSPSTDKVSPIGPTAIVLETTTIPISERVPCQAVADRVPDRPAE